MSCLTEHEVEDIDYGRVDWDESLDTEDDREAEERWFDEEEEEEDSVRYE